MSNQLQRIEMQVGYQTRGGVQIRAGDVLQGTQSRAGGPVEVLAPITGERVCFSARECGLPVPPVEIIDLCAA